MAMLRGLVTYLLENGRIETTVTRAKELRSLAERMITIAKVPSLANKRKAFAFITKEDVVKKLFDEIGPEYKDRNGGYTRIIRTGPRRGDAAEMCIIELVKDEKEAKKPRAIAGRTARGNRARRAEASKRTAAEAAPAAEEAPAEPVAEEAAAE
jgi:large subunit ribosomal protein L17